jgi:hypothetical protein
MVNATTWFYGTNGTAGLWRTTTGGVSVDGAPAWTQVNIYSSGGALQPLAAAIGSVYVATDASFYSGGNYAIVHSLDGINWTQVSNQYAPALASENGSSPSSTQEPRQRVRTSCAKCRAVMQHAVDVGTCADAPTATISQPNRLKTISGPRCL